VRNEARQPSSGRQPAAPGLGDVALHDRNAPAENHEHKTDTRLMRPLCGALAPTLHQGPLVGLLREMGLRPDQVWKLE
jgi:hypothetical protein